MLPATKTDAPNQSSTSFSSFKQLMQLEKEWIVSYSSQFQVTLINVYCGLHLCRYFTAAKETLVVKLVSTLY